MNDFTYDFPVRNYFGSNAIVRALNAEMASMGEVVMLAYGGGSLKRSGVYDQIVSLLEGAGKTVVDFGGVMSNPTYEEVQEGARLARERGVDFVLGAGGGSVFDCCKVICAQAPIDEDIYELECVQRRQPEGCLPMGCIVTLSGTGAEQNNGGVITDEERHTKAPLFGALPRFAALDPSLTLTVPAMQFMSGAFDTLTHCMETYFGTPRTPNVSDDLNLAVQRNVIRNMRAVAANGDDLAARSELVYDSAMAENGVLKIGKVTDFQCHMIQHQYGAYTHTNHGLGLAVIIPHLYRALTPSAPEQFALWAREVWDVKPSAGDALAVANAGIDELASFIAECGLPSSFAEMGSDASDETLRAVANTATITTGCARRLSSDEIFGILTGCR